MQNGKDKLTDKNHKIDRVNVDGYVSSEDIFPFSFQLVISEWFVAL